MFSHEIVPDHLRTKPDPEVEEQEKQLSAEAVRIGPELAQVRRRMDVCYLLSVLRRCLVFVCANPQKHIQALNKLCSNLLEKLNNPREDREGDASGGSLVCVNPLLSLL